MDTGEVATIVLDPASPGPSDNDVAIAEIHAEARVVEAQIMADAQIAQAEAIAEAQEEIGEEWLAERFASLHARHDALQAEVAAMREQLSILATLTILPPTPSIPTVSETPTPAPEIVAPETMPPGDAGASQEAKTEPPKRVRRLL
jgi:hypothetical protein